MSDTIVASLPRFSPLIAVVTSAIWAFLATSVSGTPGAALSVLPAFVLVIVILAVAGAATPLPLIAGSVPARRRRQATLVAIAATVPFVAALVINPDRWPGGPAPFLAESVPVFGWFFDGVMDALPLAVDTPVYNLLFSGFAVFGFYLECVLIAAILYTVLRTVAALDPGIREERPAEEEG